MLNKIRLIALAGLAICFADAPSLSQAQYNHRDQDYNRGYDRQNSQIRRLVDHTERDSNEFRETFEQHFSRWGRGRTYQEERRSIQRMDEGFERLKHYVDRSR